MVIQLYVQNTAQLHYHVSYKLYMCILNERLNEILEDNNLLSNVQGGFRRNRSCYDKINQLKMRILQNRNNNRKTHVCYLDVTKAYDMNHFGKLYL